MSWLDAPRVLLGLVAVLVPLVCVWGAVLIADAINRSTVDPSASAAIPLAVDADGRVVEASEREPACAASTPAPPPLVAAETEQVSARTCPTPVGVGDPTQS